MPEINANKRFLSPDMCRLISMQAADLREQARIELTLRGEPTLNPQVLENLAIMRECGPKFQISLFTNGVRILKDHDLPRKLLDAGVNILCIDCYNGTYDRFKDIADASGEMVVDFRAFSAYKRHSKGHTLRLINLVPDIQEGAVDVRQIHNNAGNVNPEYLQSLPGYPNRQLPMVKKCARPFRELVVYHTGDVVLCCHDWGAEHVLGNVTEQTLEGIWYGSSHLQALRQLYAGNRAGVQPCDRCDYHGGYRLGFLQDPGWAPGAAADERGAGG